LADPGGNWTGPQGQPFDGVFDPGVDAAGLYTYTVDAQEPCPDAEALLAVVVEPCAGIGEVASGVELEWVGVQGDEVLFRTDATDVCAVRMMDARGRQVWTDRMIPNAGLLRLRAPATTGLYVLELNVEGARQAVRFTR
jgi:hypothetical protein